METQFVQLNYDWNAEPDSPHERVDEAADRIDLSFVVNSTAFAGYQRAQRAVLRFHGCTRWRFGSVNDQSWARGQCRFSQLAPRWGEFYEILGEVLLELCPDDWHILSSRKSHRHFLFYFRDCEFECSADNYEFIPDAMT